MLPRTYETQECSIARALEIVGDRWTLLLMRDAFAGARRFKEFERSLGLSRKVLSERLDRLTDEGLLERVPYQERPVRHEYRLTAKGLSLWKAVAHLMFWGERFYPIEDGPPRLIRHRSCGGIADERLRCRRCGHELEDGDVELVDAPRAATAAATA